MIEQTMSDLHVKLLELGGLESRQNRLIFRIYQTWCEQALENPL